MKLAVLGCGHIGGSLALALRKANAVRAISGYDVDPAAGARARERGICDVLAASAADAARGADVVVAAVPVRAMPPLFASLGALSPSSIVTDVGSTKAGVVAAGFAAFGDRFVGAHPMAGTEHAGPDAADPSLFTCRRVILTPERAADDAVRTVTRLWETIGAYVLTMSAAHHDRVVAAVSHLPHVAAYALAATVGAIDGDVGRDLVGLAGGGFTDTTRIASTPPAMWIDVFLENRDAVLALIDSFDTRLADLRAAIARGDTGAIETLLRAAAEGRKRILG